MEMNQRIHLLVRSRARLVIAAIVLPLALFLLLERQARRLDALATRGEPVDAQVTGVSGDNGTTFYAYRVDGTEYTWNVARAAAPFPVGRTFQATYLPDDPSLSRPISDRSLAAAEAAGNRRFTWKVVLCLGLTLLLFAGLAHRDLHRSRTGAPSEWADPKASKTRIVLAALLLLPGLVLIGSFHIGDAVEKGESVVPVVISLGVAIGIIGGFFFYTGREGPTRVGARSARVLRLVAPIAAGIALLRLVAMLLGK